MRFAIKLLCSFLPIAIIFSIVAIQSIHRLISTFTSNSMAQPCWYVLGNRRFAEEQGKQSDDRHPGNQHQGFAIDS